jgi:hypothetical protein
MCLYGCVVKTVFTAATLLACTAGLFGIASSRPGWTRVWRWEGLRRAVSAAAIVGLGLLASTPIANAIADNRDSNSRTYLAAAAFILVPAAALTIGLLLSLGESRAYCGLGLLLLAVAPLPSRGVVGACARILAVALYIVVVVEAPLARQRSAA